MGFQIVAFKCHDGVFQQAAGDDQNMPERSAGMVNLPRVRRDRNRNGGAP
jgi:hypothetical protein